MGNNCIQKSFYIYKAKKISSELIKILFYFKVPISFFKGLIYSILCMMIDRRGTDSDVLGR